MKKTTLILSITLTLVCCTSKSKHEIALFNNISFKLNNAEKVISIDAKEKEMYNYYLEKIPVQIPLFRCVKAENYLTFLGIPINTTIRELADYNLSLTNTQAHFETDSTNYFFFSYQHEKNHIVVYSKIFDNNLIYILTVSNAVELSDSLFNKNALSDRFNL